MLCGLLKLRAPELNDLPGGLNLIHNSIDHARVHLIVLFLQVLLRDTLAAQIVEREFVIGDN